MLKTEHCDFRVILGEGWSLTRIRKQKNISNLWPYKSSVKSDKQNGYLQSGRVREVVASREVVTMRELTVNRIAQFYKSKTPQAKNIVHYISLHCYVSAAVPLD